MSAVRFAVAAAAALLSSLVVLAAPARAQFDEDVEPVRDYSSPEYFAVEFRVGPYQPQMDGNDAFETFFGDDDGPLLALELDYILYRVPNIIYLGAGGGMGWMNFDGNTLDDQGTTTSEETSIEIVPLNLLAVARIDVLPRMLEIPILLTGKIGYQWARWSTTSGDHSDEAGFSVGLLWGVQVGLDLDTFEPAAARNMDEEWGINHSFLFFELFGFEPSGRSLPIGDNLAWTAGLGFMF